MDRQIRRHRISIVLVLVAAVAAAAAIGAWENSASRSVEPTEATAQRSTFVQSGGAVSDIVPDASPAQQREPAGHEVAASTL